MEMLCLDCSGSINPHVDETAENCAHGHTWKEWSCSSVDATSVVFRCCTKIEQTILE